MDAGELTVLLAVFVRTAALLAVMPLLDGLSVGFRIKAALALVIALLLVPGIDPDGFAGVEGPIGLGALALREAVFGAAIGLAARLLFVALELAGVFVGYQAGFWLPRTLDPGQATAPDLVAALWSVVAGLVFLALDAHHLLLAALAASFQLPPHPAATLGEEMIRLSGRIFPLALAFAAPLMLTLWLTDLALGIAQRSVPRLDVLFISFPLKTAVTLAALAISTHLTVTLFGRLLGHLEADLTALLARP
jgi:flagellar biosynthetic protein FliR